MLVGISKRTIRGQNIAHTLPSVGPPPVFQRVDGKPQLLEFVRHGIDLLRFSREANRNVTVVSGVHIIGIHVRRHRNRRLVGSDWMGEFKTAGQRIASEEGFANQGSLAVGAASARRWSHDRCMPRVLRSCRSKDTRLCRSWAG